MTEPRDDATAAEAHGPTVEAELRTFLIADIRGYTVYTTEHGAEAAARLAVRFAEIVRDVVVAHDGFLIEFRGDEALAVFVLARRALLAALELQTRFATGLDRGVGIGLDAGEAIPVEGGYRGSALNLAARLCGQAGPGETLASEAVIHLAAKVDGIGYADPRTYHLKGIDEPVRAVRVVSAEKGSKGPIRYGDGIRLDRRVLAALGVGVIAVAVIAVGLSGVFGGRSGASPGPSGDAAASGSPTPSPELFAVDDLPAIAYIDPDTGAMTDSRQTESVGVRGESSGGMYWLLRSDSYRIEQIDETNHKTVKTIPIPVSVPGGIAADERVLWVSDFTAPRVVGIDIATGVRTYDYRLTESPDARPGAPSLTIGAGSIWVGLDADELVRLDPATGTVEARIPVGWPDVLAFDGTAVYATGRGELYRVDPATNAVTWSTKLIDPGILSPHVILPAIAFGGGFIWTVDDASGTVWKIDQTGRVAGTFQVGIGALPLAPLGDTMWVGVQDAGLLVGIDMVTAAMREIPVGHLIYSVVAGSDELLVTLDQTPEEIIAGIDGDVLTIATPATPFSNPNPDPPTNSSVEFRQAGFVTCAGLLRYPDKPAPEGWMLEPEVAAAMPEISADGRTYTFAIRDGFVFSPPSNQTITAETFRSTLLRAMSPDLGGSDKFFYLEDVEGAFDFYEGRSDDVSGIVASGDTLTIRLVAPSGDFLKRLSLPYFCPLPIGTPAAPHGLDPTPPLPSAGPYYLAKHIGAELGLFLKNPNYTGDRPQPFEAIAFRFGYEPGNAIGRVEAGQADATTSGVFEPLLNAASERASVWGPHSDNAANGDQRWFGGPRFATGYISLNPADPLLADLEVRRAISLALDRVALARLNGAAPTGALLAPSVPGSDPVGTPVPPRDVEAAKRLMAGRTGTLVMATQLAGDCPGCDAIFNEVRGELAPLGITVVAKEFKGDRWAAGLDPSNEVDLLWGNLDTDYPDAVALMGLLRANTWLPPKDLADLDRLDRLGGPERIDAAAAFARRISTDDVLVVPFYYPIYPMYLSAHVGCGFVQPAIGAVDLLSLCRKDAATASPAPSAAP